MCIHIFLAMYEHSASSYNIWLVGIRQTNWTLRYKKDAIVSLAQQFVRIFTGVEASS
jgi:hypothetical protein